MSPADFEVFLQRIGDSNPSKELRHLVLCAAIGGAFDSGAFAEPDLGDLSKLLVRRSAEKSDLASKKRQRHGAPPGVADNERPLRFASHAHFVRLGQIAEVKKGLTGIKDAKPGPYPLVVTAEERGSCDHYDFDGPAVVIPMVSSTGHGDASLKRIHYQDGKYAVGSILCAVQPYCPDLISARFLYEYLSAFKDELLVSRMIGTANVSLTVAKIADVPVPVVSTYTMRIVDRLMSLCDELDRNGRLADDQHARLTSTLFEALVSSESAHASAENWKLVAENFDLLLDRPEAVDALEQTILKLAVRGLLVPQEPNDEPASQLLMRIRTQRDRLINEGKVKREKNLSSISEEERPFPLPKQWEWVRLIDLMPEFQNGVSSRGDAGGRLVTVVRLADIKNRRISLVETRQIPIAESDIQKYRLNVGDVLITRVNGSADIVGQFNLCDMAIDAIYCDHFIRMRIEERWMSPEFCALLGESDIIRTRIKNLFITTAGQKTVNQGHIGSLVFGLPPLQEQHRIVARVKSLRCLCAELRKRLASRQPLQARLAQALVAEVI